MVSARIGRLFKHSVQFTSHSAVGSAAYLLVSVLNLGDSSYNMFVDMYLTDSHDLSHQWHHEVNHLSLSGWVSTFII